MQHRCPTFFMAMGDTHYGLVRGPHLEK
jgi:hypothetical protein